MIPPPHNPPPQYSAARNPDLTRYTPAAKSRRRRPTTPTTPRTLLTPTNLNSPPTPATRQDLFPIALASTVLGFLALVVCFSRGYLLLYGDAVAHLGIARRILDSRNPGLAQLGGVWLPLPHLLMLPFISHMDWWQNGLAGAWPSLGCYILGNLGFFALSRRLLSPGWSLVATTFYALNPNLLYLSTTAMTEPLFLAELLWITLLTAECVSSIRATQPTIQTTSQTSAQTSIQTARQTTTHTARVRRRLLLVSLVTVAAVYTRYDGWILGAAAWLLLTYHLAHHRPLWRTVAPSYILATLLTVAAPVGWLAYNQHFFHDPLDFLRGPYSPAAIEKRTSPPSAGRYHGWHNPLYALLYYTRTAQVDAAAWEFGFPLMLAALTGLALTLRRPPKPTATLRTPNRTATLTPNRTALPNPDRTALLLWLPLPFYLYSISFGSVPIFIPQLYPRAFYNARYGMELLPALALFSTLALQYLSTRLTQPREQISPTSPAKTQPPPPSSPQENTTPPPHPDPRDRRSALAARLLRPLSFLAIALNTIAMMYFTPLVLKEGMVNSTTRVAFEAALARQLESFPPGSPIMMYTSDHIGAVQRAGIPLRQILSDSDYDSWRQALSDPAHQAAYIIAIAGDPTSQAIAAHPANLTELTVLCTTNQPCARIYKSNVFPRSAEARKN